MLFWTLLSVVVDLVVVVLLLGGKLDEVATANQEARGVRINSRRTLDYLIITSSSEVAAKIEKGRG